MAVHRNNRNAYDISGLKDCPVRKVSWLKVKDWKSGFSLVWKLLSLITKITLLWKNIERNFRNGIKKERIRRIQYRFQLTGEGGGEGAGSPQWELKRQTSHRVFCDPQFEANRTGHDKTQVTEQNIIHYYAKAATTVSVQGASETHWGGVMGGYIGKDGAWGGTGWDSMAIRAGDLNQRKPRPDNGTSTGTGTSLRGDMVDTCPLPLTVGRLHGWPRNANEEMKKLMISMFGKKREIPEQPEIAI